MLGVLKTVTVAYSLVRVAVAVAVADRSVRVGSHGWPEVFEVFQIKIQSFFDTVLSVSQLCFMAIELTMLYHIPCIELQINEANSSSFRLSTPNIKRFTADFL